MEVYIFQYSGGIQHAYLHSHLTLHLSNYPGEWCIWKGWIGQGSLHVFRNVLEKIYWREVNMSFFLYLFALNKKHVCYLNILTSKFVSLFVFAKSAETYLKLFAFENLVCKGNAWEGVTWGLVLSNRCRWREKTGFWWNRLQQKMLSEEVHRVAVQKLASLLFMVVIHGSLWQDAWEWGMTEMVGRVEQCQGKGLARGRGGFSHASSVRAASQGTGFDLPRMTLSQTVPHSNESTRQLWDIPQRVTSKRLWRRAALAMLLYNISSQSHHLLQFPPTSGSICMQILPHLFLLPSERTN